MFMMMMINLINQFIFICEKKTVSYLLFKIVTIFEMLYDS